MAKFISDDALDAAGDVVALSTVMTLCNAQPTTRTEAITTFKLADVVMTAGVGGGDYTRANGDTNGRKVTVVAQTAVPVDSSGTGTHIALCDSTRLLYVTTCTSQAVVSGNTVDFPAFDVEFADVV